MTHIKKPVSVPPWSFYEAAVVFAIRGEKDSVFDWAGAAKELQGTDIVQRIKRAAEHANISGLDNKKVAAEIALIQQIAVDVRTGNRDAAAANIAKLAKGHIAPLV